MLAVVDRQLCLKHPVQHCDQTYSPCTVERRQRIGPVDGHVRPPIMASRSSALFGELVILLASPIRPYQCCRHRLGLLRRTRALWSAALLRRLKRLVMRDLLTLSSRRHRCQSEIAWQK